VWLSLTQALVAHAYNPSYSGGSDQEDHGSKPAWANSLWDPISTKPITKKVEGGGEAMMWPKEQVLGSKPSTTHTKPLKLHVPLESQDGCWSFSHHSHLLQGTKRKMRTKKVYFPSESAPFGKNSQIPHLFDLYLVGHP
jgi:hypothetical protein